jgi:hypothetical protein
MRSLVNVALLAILAAPAALAQYGARPSSERPEDALALPPRPVPGVAALVLERAADLALSDSQRVLIESIRRTQDSANRPWIQQLDSLRPSRRPANGPNDLSQEQRDEIAARRHAIAVIMDGMRENNTCAHDRTMTVLSPEQQERAAELEKEARKKADEDRARRGREALGGRGRPPED